VEAMNHPKTPFGEELRTFASFYAIMEKPRRLWEAPYRSGAIERFFVV